MENKGRLMPASEAKNKVGLAVVLIYILLVFAALIFAVVNLTKSAFAGLYLVVLTLPWSFAFAALLDKLGIQDSVPITLKLLTHVILAIVNASLIYFITRSLGTTERS